MKTKSFLIAVLLIIISLPAIYPIITPGYFPMHDDTQAARVDQMYKALSAGQFPVRWVPDLGYGYGYPIFNFYNPLPYYFGALFMFLGLDALIAAKMMFIFPVILSGLTIYLFSKTLFPRWGAFLASILYVYAPYHAVQIYVRGAIAEYWAYAILPLVFYAVWKNKIILGGISLATLITSHNLTAFLSIPFLALAVLLQSHKNYNGYKWQKTATSLLIGLGLSAFFWIPAILEANKTQVSQMVFEKFDSPSLHLIKPFQLWTGQWGWGGSSPGTDDGLSLQLGKVHLVGSLAAIAILLSYVIPCLTRNLSRIKSGTSYRFQLKAGMTLTIFSVVGLLFSLFMMFPFSTPIWNSTPLLSYIQFPWRFLTFASLFSSILAAWAIWKTIKIIKDIKNIKLLLFALCSLLFALYSIKFFQPQFKYPTTAEELTSRERILWDVSRRSDEYLSIGFIRPKTLEEALRVDNPTNHVLVDELKKPTPIRRIGNTISVITVIGMIGYYERLYRRRRR